MINRLFTTVLATFYGGLKDKSKIISLTLQQVSIPPFDKTSMQNPLLGLFVSKRQEFPDRCLIVLRGQIIIGKEIQNPPKRESLRINVDFSARDNPSINGPQEKYVFYENNGIFEAHNIILLRENVPRFRLIGTISIENTNLPVESQRFNIENAHMGWLLDFIDREERRISPNDRLYFVSSIRKLYFSDSFEKLVKYLLGRNASPIYESNSDIVQRIRSAETVWFGDDELIRIGHVLVGIESGRKQSPLPKLPDALDKHFGDAFRQIMVPLVGDLLTWAGDLGSVLNKYLYQHFYTEYYFGSNPNKVQRKNYDNFDGYFQLATRDQLVADIDGVNLADIYDRSQPLANNLYNYYIAGNINSRSKKRFSYYIQTQKTDDGKPALTIDLTSPIPKISSSSRQFLAKRIAIVAKFFLIATVVEAAMQMKENPSKIPYKEEAMTKLEPSSPEVQKLVDFYSEFLENGLAKEGNR